MSSGALLVDTSVAVPYVLPDHEAHGSVTVAVRGRPLRLAGHAALETYSVLTRLPAPVRRSHAAVHRLLRSNFEGVTALGSMTLDELLETCARLGIAGGAVYDAAVGAVAVEQAAPLATRDRRALPTYARLGVEVELLA